MGNLTQPWNYFFSSFVWQVWKRRNDFVFNGECMSLADVYRLSLAWASHFSALYNSLLHHSLAHTEAVSWKPPPIGLYVLNSDVAVYLHLALVAWAHGIERLQIQSDCAYAIRLLNDVSHACIPLPLVHAINLLCLRGWFTEFIWIPRECNMVADAMSKLLPMQQFQLLLFYSAPDSVKPLTDRDIHGPPYQRHVMS
ncbi:hypothetical protein V6N11_054321 [Hibiscus sabdariffa]|uniref:RNase H type-1 domain-containing protein n=1 Tax=Hibiscus sabdariffa TaxID=183260 RepID=A0ABR2S3Q1_9ROSI